MVEGLQDYLLLMKILKVKDIFNQQLKISEKCSSLEDMCRKLQWKVGPLGS